jgi:hypothetical protein
LRLACQDPRAETGQPAGVHAAVGTGINRHLASSHERRQECNLGLAATTLQSIDESQADAGWCDIDQPACGQ